MRRLVIIFGFAVVGALIALALLPWWLGPVARAVGGHYGARFARYERVGYARFALRDVVVEQQNVRVGVDRVETETPLLWLFHRLKGTPSAIVASNWRVEVKASNAAGVSSGDSGAMKTRAILFRVADALERWVPQAEAGTGTVSWPGATLQFAAVRWKGRSFTAQSLRYRGQASDVAVTFTKDGGEIQLEAKPADDAPWRASLKSVRDEITGELRAWDQVAILTARLPEHGWMPTAAQLRAERWAVPGARLKLGEFYSTVRGDARIEWRDGRFDAAAEVQGEVLKGTKAPALAGKLHAQGDRETLTVDALSLNVPGANASLSKPVVLSRKGGGMREASRFALEIDLEKQPWLSGAKGRVSGRADVALASEGWPHIEATLAAQNLAMGDWSVARFNTAATLDWPRLQMKETVLGFAEGGQLTAHGGWDFNAKELNDAVIDGEIRPSAVAHWLPEKIGFESATLAIKAHGPIAALQHEGRAQIAALSVPKMNPLAVDVTWRGTGAAIEISEARVQAGASRIAAVGTLDATSARMTALKFTHGETERLALAQPAVVRWSPTLDIGRTQLTGADGSVTFAMTTGENGHVDFVVRNFPSEWITDFAAVPGPEWRLVSLDAQGKWGGGPANFTTRGELAVTLSPERSAQMKLAAQGDREGIKIESLTVLEGAAPIVNATGRLPLTLRPGAASFVQLENDAPLALHATTASNPAFWTKLTEATGLEFQEPEVAIELSGTWAQPRGEVTAKATRVSADPKRIKFAFPLVESLDAHATADSKGLHVDRLSLSVEKQAVRANGNLAFTVQQWDEFKKSPLAFLRREGSLRLEIPDADIAALARYAPEYLAPTGRLQVDATVKPGGEMSGVFRLRDAATRPLGPLGVLQEVQAEAQFAGRTIEVKNVTANAGGQPVTLTGKIQLPLDAAPKYDLALKGENLPLVRQTGLLLRADLDLKLVTQGDNGTAVTGVVTLRDSMFLSDVRAMIPHGGGGGPARRPPFFAIDGAPLNAWRLGVDVRGEKFLRLRSTVFTGTASAKFRLGGTLGEPRATGEATVDSGQVLLPFAAFRVEQGTVRLTEADPYELRLFLTGTSRRYGYDLRMELTGTATDPIVTFSSSPPLEAKQVLLMVTAGETPRDEVTYGSAQRVARLGSYLGQSLINSFGGDSDGSELPTLSSGERVSRQGRETYDVEYNLSERWALVAEYDEFDEYNAGVKWRVLLPKKQAEKKETAAPKPPSGKEAADAPAK